jgi:hypothetical protein
VKNPDPTEKVRIRLLEEDAEKAVAEFFTGSGFWLCKDVKSTAKLI